MAATEWRFRPTEAQLRWAQFHHAKNAKAVREQIIRLQLAQDEDCIVETQKGIAYSAKRLQQLKESEENYWKRHELIQEKGYRVFYDEEDDDNGDDTESLLLAELFHDAKRPTTLPKRGRQRKRKQFQAIYRLLLRKLHGTDAHTILHSDKRWQRSGPSAETFLVDGRDNTDLTPWKAGMLLVDWNDDEEVASLVQELHRQHPDFCHEILHTKSSSSTLSSLYAHDPASNDSWVQRIVRELEHQHGAQLFGTVLPDIPVSTSGTVPPTRVRCNKQVLAKLLPSYLFRQSQQQEEEDDDNDDEEETELDDFKRRLLDSVLQQLEGDQGGGDHLSLESPSELVTILERYMSVALEAPPEPKIQQQQQQDNPSFFGRLRQSMSLSTKVSELFHSLDMETYATFRRRSQEREKEDSTSVSSFRILPDGIRKAVQHHLGKSKEVNDPFIEIPRAEDPPEIRHESKEDGSTTVDEISIAPECADLDVKYHSKLLKTLELTPELIQKRWQQAVTCLHNEAWKPAQMLLRANPWLAELSMVPSNQYLLHVAVMGYPPDELIAELLKFGPNAIYKWDADGNLPLHYASSGTLAAHLGDRFPSGASVRNEQGMLPLHLAVQASCVTAVPTLTGYFGSGLAVADNEGNLPIHYAAMCKGDRRDVLEMIEYLLKEADRQVNENHLRFRQKVPKTLEDDETMDTNMTKDFEDETSNCLIVRNDMGDTPLSLAIYHKAGWNVIDALTTHSGGLQGLDEHENTALHLVTSEEYADPAATLAILRKAPEAATIHNEHGVLPIENACMLGFPREVIMGLVLVDLPINLDQKKQVELREEAFGESWWYITCDCDDHYVDVVKEVMGLCNYEQAKALCFIADGPDVLFRRASPKCKQTLANSMRFCGRFEIHDEGHEEGTFNAVDFGTPFDPIPEGQRVLIRSYSSREDFEMDTEVARSIDLDLHYFEEILAFAMDQDDPKRGSLPNGRNFFASVERPGLMLSSVVKGMLVNRDCRSNTEVRWRYSMKVFSVLRLISKSLRRLHAQGFIHGDVSVSSCGKFYERWKLIGLLGSCREGTPFKKGRLSNCAPPEAVEARSTRDRVRFRNDITARVSVDSWAFGKLAFEALVGQPLLAPEDSENCSTISEDDTCLLRLVRWSDVDIQDVRQELKRVGVPIGACELIGSCLSPEPNERPTMEQILKHNVWSELKENAASNHSPSHQKMLV